MPARDFDGRRVRAVRRAADLTQHDVAAALGVGRVAVAKWETGKTVPDGDKLPAIARVLGKPIDELFPRASEPDLADVRCDAGFTQVQTAEIIGSRSHMPVSKAERGISRLDPAYVPLLAKAYGVSTEELLAAQERSFGVETPAPSAASASRQAVPQTLSEKITYLLEQTYPGQRAPADGEIAQVINTRAGRNLVTDTDVRALRTGSTTSVDPKDPAVLEGLAEAFQVSPLFFQPNEAVARQVTEGIRFLASMQRGTILGLEARGTGDGLPAEMIAKINVLVADIQQGRIPGVGGDEQL